MNTKELKEMELMDVAGGFLRDARGNLITKAKLEEMKKQREIREMKADGFTYSHEDGITVISKEF